MVDSKGNSEIKTTFNVKINDQQLMVPEGITILEAAHEAGVKIPTLCHLDLHDFQMYNKTASCRVCMVELMDEKTTVINWFHPA